MFISSSDYHKRDCRMIPVISLQDVIADFYQNSSGGDSYLDYKDKSYCTDVGYAFDGIYIILEILESELNIKLIPEDIRNDK